MHKSPVGASTPAAKNPLPYPPSGQHTDHVLPGTHRVDTLIDKPKKVMIFVDFESIWGMPSQDPSYDLSSTTHRILDLLDKYSLKATFFIVGRLLETHPHLIRLIAKRGHVTGIHGYEHESLGHLDGSALASFSSHLYRSEDLMESLTGSRPIAFRSPYLMSPLFYTPELYAILYEHGYRYVSNREVRYQQEIFHPNRIGIKYLLNKDNLFTTALDVIINWRLLMVENVYGRRGVARYLGNLLWLVRGCEPFMRGGILEVPVYSPLDCDLVGLPRIREATSDLILEYAAAATSGVLMRRCEFGAVNVHDWIIGTQNRINMFESVLRTLCGRADVKCIGLYELMDAV